MKSFNKSHLPLGQNSSPLIYQTLPRAGPCLHAPSYPPNLMQALNVPSSLWPLGLCPGCSLCLPYLLAPAGDFQSFFRALLSITSFRKSSSLPLSLHRDDKPNLELKYFFSNFQFKKKNGNNANITTINQKSRAQECIQNGIIFINYPHRYVDMCTANRPKGNTQEC